MLTCVRWYVAYPLSLRHLEEIMAERGISVDYSTVHRWALKLLPALNRIFHRHKRPVGKSWRWTMPTSRSAWPVEVLVPGRRHDGPHHRLPAACEARQGYGAALFARAIAQHGQPDTVTIDGSPANLAALHDLNAGQETPIAVRRVKF